MCSARSEHELDVVLDDDEGDAALVAGSRAASRPTWSTSRATSSPDVGSSSSTRRGCVASARAISTIRPVPSGRNAAGRSATASSPSSDSMPSTASSSPGVGRLAEPDEVGEDSERSRRSCTRWATTRCSRTVSSPNSSSRWNVRASPRRARRCGLARVMSTPSSRTRPARGRTSPDRTPNSVVLPAPFGPDEPDDRACGARQVDASSATTPPYGPSRPRPRAPDRRRHPPSPPATLVQRRSGAWSCRNRTPRPARRLPSCGRRGLASWRDLPAQPPQAVRGWRRRRSRRSRLRAPSSDRARPRRAGSATSDPSSRRPR